MDYGKAIEFTFQDKDWIASILIGGALILASVLFVWTIIIPLLVAAVIAGYMMKLIRDVRENPDAGLPRWTDWGEKLADGFKLIVVLFIWALPAFLFFIPSFLLALLLGLYPDSESLMILLSISVVAMGLLAMVYIVTIVFVQPAITINLAVQRDFVSGLEVGTIFSITKAHFVDILIILIILFGMNYVASFVGMLLFFIGVAFTGFWVILVRGHLYGQLARLAIPVVDMEASRLITPAAEDKPVPASD